MLRVLIRQLWSSPPLKQLLLQACGARRLLLTLLPQTLPLLLLLLSPGHLLLQV
jgi:hypothetical protein